jgi:hypothetical protein
MGSRKTVGVENRERTAKRRLAARKNGLCFHLCGRPADPCGVCAGAGVLAVGSLPTSARPSKCGRCKGTGKGATCFACRAKMRERKRAAS